MGLPLAAANFKKSPSSASLRSAPSPLHGEGLRAGLGPARGRGTPLPCGMAWAAHPGGRALRALWSTEGGRVRTPAPTKYGELSGLFVGAGPRPARKRGNSLSPLSRYARHLPLIRGVGPSPAEWHGRRIQEAAPYGRYGPRRAGGHTGPPLRANRNISGRAGEDTRPCEIRGPLRSFRRGRTLAGP